MVKNQTAVPRVGDEVEFDEFDAREVIKVRWIAGEIESMGTVVGVILSKEVIN